METGKLPVNVLKHSVLNHIHKYREEVRGGAAIGKDCAAISLFPGDPDLLVGTCHREGLPVLSGQRTRGDQQTMAQLLTKCANNLSAGGFTPVGAELTLLLPEGTEREQTDLLMREADEACKALNMQIIGGQTRVMTQVSEPVAVLTGYGETARAAQPGERPGMDVLITKWIGLEGTALLAELRGEEIRRHYPDRLVREAMDFAGSLSVLPEAEIAMREDARMHDASEGGILAALWEIAEGAGVGLDLDLRAFPIRQETVEISECCGVNPYELLSGGSLVIFAADGPLLEQRLREAGIPATIVGRTTDGKARILHNAEEIRYLDRPARDPVYGIYCPGSQS